MNEEQNKLESERKRYFDLYDLAPIGYLTICDQGRILKANLAVVTMLGVSRNTLLNREVSEFIYHEDKEIYYQQRKKCFESNSPQVWEMRLLRGDASLFWAHLQATPARSGEYWITLNDISSKKRAETYIEMGWEISQILMEPSGLHESIRRVLDVLKTRTGFDAVGIRLQEGDDFPYIAQNGFSTDFMLTENTLIERSVDGGVCRDSDGNISLECTCGLVISGRTDPANPLFTGGGSCWTNDSSPLLAIPSERDPRLHPRNNCIHQGYASVALVPIRDNDKILGLVQFNDRQKKRFTLETIRLLEGIASLMGLAIMRKRLEHALLESEARYQRITEGL